MTLIQKLRRFYKANQRELEDAGVDGYLLDAIADAEHAEITNIETLIEENIIKPFSPQREWGVFNKTQLGVK